MKSATFSTIIINAVYNTWSILCIEQSVASISGLFLCEAACHWEGKGKPGIITTILKI